jgi:hypothetical protein
MPRAATEKHFPLVQKLWTPKLPCGKPWKTTEEIVQKKKAGNRR